MIPLRDVIPSRTTPVVTVSLIVLNALVFFYELSIGDAIEEFVLYFGLVPAAFSWVAVFTSMFLHGGFLHFGGNMLYLWIFGDNVEDRMGHGRYLGFYLLCGWTASYAHVWSDPASRVPSLGASGAIAGVLAAYLTLYPHARVVTLIPFGIFTRLVQIPAVFFLVFWFLQQFIFGVASLAARTAQTGGVAWFAHIGGFVAGLALVWLFRDERRKPPRRDTWWEGANRPRRARGW